jgi:pilus assembly protein CpaF
MIQGICRQLGHVLDRQNPIVDLLLPDGTRVHITIPPATMTGPSLVIRKFPHQIETIDELIKMGAASPQMLAFLTACVQARMNICVAGGNGSGKTTFLSVLTRLIPVDERLITIEMGDELGNMEGRRVVRLSSHPANMHGEGGISSRHLVINALKMRPERLVIGEIGGGEIIDFLAAINTGHNGSMFSIHSNNTRDTLQRLEVMGTMAGLDIPLLTIREQLASAIDIVVQMRRLVDGSRVVTHITELTGIKNHMIELQDLFTFQVSEQTQSPRVGHFTGLGIRPQSWRFQQNGISLSDEMFAVVTA